MKLKDRVEYWQGRLRGDDLEELVLVAAGYDLAARAYKSEKTTSTHKALIQARKALIAHLDGLDEQRPAIRDRVPLPPDLSELEQACTDTDARDLRASYAAWVQAVEKFEAQGTPAAAEAKDALGRSFAETRSRLEEKYLGTSQVLPNLLRGIEWLQAQGWDAKKTKIYEDRKAGKIKLLPGGKVSTRDLELYAVRAELKKYPSPADDDGSSSRAAMLAQKKTESQAALAQAQAEKKRLEVGQLRGLLLPRWIVDRELADRARAARMHLSPMVSDTVDLVLDMLGGSTESAAEIVSLVHGDPDKAGDLQRWVNARKSEILGMYKPHLRKALDCWVTGEWFTAEMAQAWGVYETHREELEAALMRRLLAEAGGKKTMADKLLEKYQVYERRE